MKKILYAIFILLVSVVHCHADGKVIIATCDPWPPFVDPSAPKEGLSLEIIRAAFATQGYTVKMKYLPWARAEESVKRGKFDILPPTWMTEKRKKYFLFSEPYAVNQIKFIKRVDDPFEYENLDSLSGKKVGTIRGYGYDDAFLHAKNFTREEAPKFITNIKKLIDANKRIDLTLEDEIVARVKIANENPDILNQISFTQKSLTENKLYIASGFANPRHKEIIGAFNKGLAAIKANGEYDNIMKQYGF